MMVELAFWLTLESVFTRQTVHIHKGGYGVVIIRRRRQV
jgi:hypothetical protein